LFLARQAGYFYALTIRVTRHYARTEKLENAVMSDLLLRAFDNQPTAGLPELCVGDDVTVHFRINVGDRNERTQIVRGMIIRLRNTGNNHNFTVRRIASNGIGVERTFLYRSPRIEKIEVHRHAHVRQANLYFMRQRTGKSARLREKRAF
jgi:large subunit ribosomal protein L19